MSSTPYLNPGLPEAGPMVDGLDAPYWAAAAEGRLELQRCKSCGHWQWGPEWICHKCLSFDMGWEEVKPEGIIYSWERCWHPSHPALKEQGPYIVILAELPQAGNIRMVGNLLGDPLQEIEIGARIVGHFEHHTEAENPFTLLQWEAVK